MTRSLLTDVPLFGVFWAYVVFIVPAATVCVLKRRWLLFIVGYLTFGITWFIGALCTADPESWWHGRFNATDPDPETRAFATLRNRRRMRVILVAVVAVALFGLVAARPATIVGVDGESLQSSVGGIAALSDACEKMRDKRWRCFVYDDAISGDIAYRVSVGPLGCWKAKAMDERSGGVRVAEPKLDGCMTFFHTGLRVAPSIS